VVSLRPSSADEQRAGWLPKMAAGPPKCGVMRPPGSIVTLPGGRSRWSTIGALGKTSRSRPRTCKGRLRMRPGRDGSPRSRGQPHKSHLGFPDVCERLHRLCRPCMLPRVAKPFPGAIPAREQRPVRTSAETGLSPKCRDALLGDEPRRRTVVNERRPGVTISERTVTRSREGREINVRAGERSRETM
jgi:hypothetical protein